jgi:hypothetical protein
VVSFLLAFPPISCIKWHSRHSLSWPPPVPSCEVKHTERQSVKHSRREQSVACGSWPPPPPGQRYGHRLAAESFCLCLGIRTLGPSTLYPHGFQDNLLRIKVISSTVTFFVSILFGFSV